MDPDRAAEPHPDIQQVLAMREAAGVPDLDECTPEEARNVLAEAAGALQPPVEMAAVDDRTIPGPDGDLPIRIYEPEDGLDDGPVVLYAHGGGWVTGSLETADAVCRQLADETGYAVVSVDYRLAPEHPFPAGLRDVYAALEWVTDAAAAGGEDLEVDPERIVLAGDSAGGNLAAAAALLARDRGGPEVAHQLLLYPVTGDPSETASYEQNGEDAMLTADEMAWFEAHYFADDLDRRNGYAAPRQLHDLSGLPPATIVTAGFDPLRDDGAAYAERLRDDGVLVTYHNYPGAVHGFFGMIAPPADVEPAHEAHADVTAALREALE